MSSLTKVSYRNVSGSAVPPHGIVQLTGAPYQTATGDYVFRADVAGIGNGPYMIDDGKGADASGEGSYGSCFMAGEGAVWVAYNAGSASSSGVGSAIPWCPIGPVRGQFYANESAGGFLWTGIYEAAKSRALVIRASKYRGFAAKTTSAITTGTESAPSTFTVNQWVKTGSSWPYARTASPDSLLRDVTVVNRSPNLVIASTGMRCWINWDDEASEWYPEWVGLSIMASKTCCCRGTSSSSTPSSSSSSSSSSDLSSSSSSSPGPGPGGGGSGSGSGGGGSCTTFPTHDVCAADCTGTSVDVTMTDGVHAPITVTCNRSFGKLYYIADVTSYCPETASDTRYYITVRIFGGPSEGFWTAPCIPNYVAIVTLQTLVDPDCIENYPIWEWEVQGEDCSSFTCNFSYTGAVGTWGSSPCVSSVLFSPTGGSVTGGGSIAWGYDYSHACCKAPFPQCDSPSLTVNISRVESSGVAHCDGAPDVWNGSHTVNCPHPAVGNGDRWFGYAGPECCYFSPVIYPCDPDGACPNAMIVVCVTEVVPGTYAFHLTLSSDIGSSYFGGRQYMGYSGSSTSCSFFSELSFEDMCCDVDAIRITVT